MRKLVNRDAANKNIDIFRYFICLILKEPHHSRRKGLLNYALTVAAYNISTFRSLLRNYMNLKEGYSI